MPWVHAGLRVPGIIAWPRGYGTRPRVLDVPTSNLDILPTIAAIAGLPVPPHVSDTGYAPAGPGVVDGRNLGPLLEGRLAPGERVHDVIFSLCDTTVAVARDGKYKVHFTTAHWEDETLQACPTKIICDCNTNVHDPPLVFDLTADPGELNPLNLTRDADAMAAAERMAREKARLEASFIPVQSQTELMPALREFPCCGFPEPGWRRVAAILLDQCGC